MQCTTKTCAQLRCFENGNDDFGVEAFWIGDAARVGYFVPLNGPLNGHPPSILYYSVAHGRLCHKCILNHDSQRLFGLSGGGGGDGDG